MDWYQNRGRAEGDDFVFWRGRIRTRRNPLDFYTHEGPIREQELKIESDDLMDRYFRAEKSVLLIWIALLLGFGIYRVLSAPEQDLARESSWLILGLADYLCLARVAAGACRVVGGTAKSGEVFWLAIFGSLKITCLIAMGVVLFRASFTMGVTLSGVSALIIVPIFSGLLARE